MWIFLNDSFLSIVADRDQPNSLMVRARIRGDIERVFPGYDVVETPSADYAFRATIPRRIVAGRLAAYAASIGYDNFKDSVADYARHDAYIGVWTTMHRYGASAGRARTAAVKRPA